MFDDQRQALRRRLWICCGEDPKRIVKLAEIPRVVGERLGIGRDLEKLTGGGLDDEEVRQRTARAVVDREGREELSQLLVLVVTQRLEGESLLERHPRE